MHTRYAPVRHSRPPEGGLPSDLHVLGLPLAFILKKNVDRLNVQSTVGVGTTVEMEVNLS